MVLPSSSSSTSEWIYDVFLSFRGEDTRKNFTDHLYVALNRVGIRTFRDDTDLERGEEIGPDLLKAIERSRYSIIVFSKNYASSTWCLNELEHIMKCRKTGSQTVLPVFYDVEPSEVRKQKRSFEEAFGGHEDRFKEQKAKLDSWRVALKEAADLKGYDVQNRHESTIIDKIVEDISNKLHLKRLDVATNPVGIDSRASKVTSLLYDESTDVRIVGIYGIGGIGKTTIAKEVYNSIVSQFEGGSFLANVRENSNPKDRVDLQNQLLYDILKGKHEKISNSDRGLNVIEERLCNIKVLVVLDDVDELEQINKILGNFHVWLSKGSRIIITTRIKDLLPSRVYRQHELEELNEFESLRLFSINAFGEWHPVEEYSKCSKSFVDYCGGIPLALEVLGSYLSGQSVDVWESKFEKLEEIPHASIQDVLEISCRSLDVTEREIFLDIACFFIGKNKDYIISILDGCDFFAVDGINTLIRRCLVKIEYPNKLVMHDLIQDMGRKIVFKECPKECRKRSRVWHHKEAFNLLLHRKGTEAVEGLSLNVPISNEISTKAFKEMKNLRLLRLNSVNLSGSYKHISKELQWLCWNEFHLESIPTDLDLGNLVALDLPYNSLKQLWEEEKFLEKLKILNLSHSHELKETPNFKWLPNLEILRLEDCPILVEVHESIGHLTKLVTLNLKDCRNLVNLPRSFCALRSLENLIVSGCSKLDKLPEELGNMKSLVVFAADGTAISRVPKSFRDLKSLTSLDLGFCQLKPTSIKGPNLSGFLSVSLRKLELRYCNLSDGMIPNYLQNLSLLEHLNLCGNNFSSLPPSISLLPELRYLWLTECLRLKSIPKLPSSLLEIYAWDCVKLERINLTNICGKLFVYGCRNLVEIKGVFKVEPARGLQGVWQGVSCKLFCVPLVDIFASRSMRKMNSLTETSRISSPEYVTSKGVRNLFVRGSEIPICCTDKSKGNSVTFTMHHRPGFKTVGFKICVVYAWSEFFESFDPYNIIRSIEIRIFNETKWFHWIYNPTVFFSNVAQEDIRWLTYWDFKNVMESGEGTDKIEFKSGDRVHVEIIQNSPCILVKECGIGQEYTSHRRVWTEAQIEAYDMWFLGLMGSTSKDACIQP